MEDVAKAPKIEAKLLAEVVEESHAWAVAHGLVMGLPGGNAGEVVHAPISLLPSPLPRSAYDQVVALARDFNVLVHRASNDHAFICSSLESAARADSFTANLLAIYKKVYADGKRQAIELGLHRSDYMMHQQPEGPPIPLQVELNTISSAFACLSSNVAQMHRYVLGKVAGLQSHFEVSDSTLPPNKSGYALADGMAKAWELYGDKTAVVAMMVQPGEKNSTDQRWLEYTLWDRHQIRMIRRSLKDLHDRGSIDASSGALLIDGMTVAVTYFRAGYTPNDYPTQDEWQARELIERSNTVQCPSLAYHLVGAKKIQQVLSKDGVLERFFPDDAERVARLRKCFAGLYSLDEGESEEAIKDALANPDDYVMKPQREGGGNNLYGEKLQHALTTMSAQERAAHILMQRIKPQPYEAYVYRRGESSLVQAICELGIFSVYVSKGDEEFINEDGGHLLRTKTASSDEGGVAAGFAVLDSPYLTTW